MKIIYSHEIYSRCDTYVSNYLYVLKCTQFKNLNYEKEYKFIYLNFIFNAILMNKLNLFFHKICDTGTIFQMNDDLKLQFRKYLMLSYRSNLFKNLNEYKFI